jgi:hypothetical protein
MHRRSLNIRFKDKALAGIKTTTIRDKVWPIGVPIMLFHWADKPYRSKQIEIAPIIVTAATPIDISLGDFSDCLIFSHIIGLDRPLWQCEGFNGPLDMNDWFLPKIKPRTTVTKFLHRFQLYTDFT